MNSENIQSVSKKIPVWFYSKNYFETESTAKEDIKHGTKFSISPIAFIRILKTIQTGKNDGSKDLFENL